MRNNGTLAGRESEIAKLSSYDNLTPKIKGFFRRSLSVKEVSCYFRHRVFPYRVTFETLNIRSNLIRKGDRFQNAIIASIVAYSFWYLVIYMYLGVLFWCHRLSMNAIWLRPHYSGLRTCFGDISVISDRDWMRVIISATDTTFSINMVHDCW